MPAKTISIVTEDKYILLRMIFSQLAIPYHIKFSLSTNTGQIN